MEEGAKLGFHLPFLQITNETKVKEFCSTATAVCLTNAYKLGFQDMRMFSTIMSASEVSDEVIDDMLATSANDMFWYGPEEARKHNLVNTKKWVPSLTIGQDLAKGLSAYQSGDYETALKEWKTLAEQGNAEAQNSLGIMYINGEAVQKDDTEAMRLFRLAAEQGYSDAQLNLARMYFESDGVAQDVITAHMWAVIAESYRVVGANDFMMHVQGFMGFNHMNEGWSRAKVCMASNYKDCD